MNHSDDQPVTQKLDEKRVFVISLMTTLGLYAIFSLLIIWVVLYRERARMSPNPSICCCYIKYCEDERTKYIEMQSNKNNVVVPGLVLATGNLEARENKIQIKDLINVKQNTLTYEI